MRVRIVCYEDVNAWILGKFALKLQENLIKLGISADIAKVPEQKADINHHIIYYTYNGKKTSIDTLMVTHIDNIEKLELLKSQIKVASLFICMSSDTMNWLARMGIDKNKLCYINPAHDQQVKIKKYIIGITSRVQADGRKREKFIDNLAEDLDPRYFTFRFMGDSWDSQVSNLRRNGFEVDYIDHFVREEYFKLINSLDYYLYMGLDEGQMGFIDAVAAGIKTIVTPQGYHLDAENAITHPFTSYDELLAIFLELQNSRSRLVNSVALWNWEDYTLKHVELWEYLLGKRNIKSSYKDGLNSLISMDADDIEVDKLFIQNERKKLRRTKNLQQLYIWKNTTLSVIRKIKSNGLSWIFSKILHKFFQK
jgi:hypothetical protein